MKAPPPTCGPIRVGNGMEGDMTMANLAMMLRGVGGAGRPVVDKTGLTGSYRIKVEFDRMAGWISRLRLAACQPCSPLCRSSWD
jgi:uncharacterized protein (TIGR03435 family)